MADVTNAQIAAAFEELADLYELDEASQYRVIAYRTAARTVREAPVSVMGLTRFGPKRARRLYDELGVDSLESLHAAAQEGRIRGLRGFGAKVEENLLRTLAEGADGRPAPRILLPRALAIAEQVLGALRAH